MSYLLLSACFLLAAFVLALLLRRRGSSVSWPAIAFTAAALLVLTAVFDSLMIGAGLFAYEPSLISGAQIGLAPLEDFAYPIAAAIALPALWTLLTRPGSVGAAELLRHAFVASRPISWINTAFPFAASMLLVTREIDAVLVIGTLYYLVPYNLAMYGINDVFDYDSDINNPRKGGIEGGVLPPAFHRPLLWLVVAGNVPFLLLLLAVGTPASRIAITVSTFAVIAYSTPKLRFKERPVLDSLTSSTHFVSPAVAGLALAGAEFDGGDALLLGAFFAWGVAAHAFGAVQDIAPDRAAGIASIATAFGARRTVLFALALWSLAGALILATPSPAPLPSVIALPYLINCAPYLRLTDATAARANRAWRRFIWLNYISGFLVTMILALAWSAAS